MAQSSHTKGSILIDLFNLPALPDGRRQTTLFCKIPNDFFLPDGKNSRLSQIVNTLTFGRLTPDGNEGVGIKISYLESVYGMKYYVVDQVNGNINAIHDDSLESTEFMGHFCPFNLEELELKLCKIMDHHENVDDSRLDDNMQKVTQSTPSLQQPLQPNQQGSSNNSDLNSRLRNMDDLTDMGFSLPDYSPIPTASSFLAGTGIPTLTPSKVRGDQISTILIPHITEVRSKWWIHLQVFQIN